MNEFMTRLITIKIKTKYYTTKYYKNLKSMSPGSKAAVIYFATTVVHKKRKNSVL